MIIGKVKKGRGHWEKGMPCQDRIAIYNNDGIKGIVIADGAGSRYGSEILADDIARGMLDYFVNNFEYLYKNEDIVSIIKEQCIKIIEGSVKKSACTLLLYFVKDGRYICVHVGDGTIIKKSKDHIEVFSKPFNGEYLNETCFCELMMSKENIRVRKGIEDAEALIMASDGIGTQLYDSKREVLAEAVEVIFEWTNGKNSDLIDQLISDAMENIFYQGTKDDLSIGIMINGEGLK